MLQHDLYIFFSEAPPAARPKRKWWKGGKREGKPYCKKVEGVKSNVVSAGGEVLQGSSWSNAWHNPAEKGVSAKKRHFCATRPTSQPRLVLLEPKTIIVDLH